MLILHIFGLIFSFVFIDLLFRTRLMKHMHKSHLLSEAPLIIYENGLREYCMEVEKTVMNNQGIIIVHDD